MAGHQQARKPKVLIIYPPKISTDWGGWIKIKPHLICLLAFLRKNKIDAEVLDLENEGHLLDDKGRLSLREKMVNLIAPHQFDVAGISCWSSLNYQGSILAAEICRQINDKSVILVGGYHPSAVPSDFAYRGSPFDVVVKGEGEDVLLNICSGRVKSGRETKIIGGTCLDLPPPDALIDTYAQYKYAPGNKAVPVILSRSCPFSCAFCMEPSKGARGWRSYSAPEAGRLIQAIRGILRPEQIHITDACFGFNKEWRRTFLRHLIKSRIRTQFWAESRVDLLEKEDIDLVSKLNFKLDLGIESGSGEMLLNMKKTRQPRRYLQRSKEVMAYMNKMNVAYQVYLIFNHPGETPDTYKETIRFFDDFFSSQARVTGLPGSQPFAFFPGSHVYLNIKAYEQKFGTRVRYKEWWKMKTGQPRRLATSVVASRALLEKFGTSISYWESDMMRLVEKTIRKNIHLLRFADSDKKPA